MATRNSDIISEQFIPAASGIAIVRELAGEKENKFEIINEEEIPNELHAAIIDQAKNSEKQVKKNG